MKKNVFSLAALIVVLLVTTSFTLFAAGQKDVADETPSVTIKWLFINEWEKSTAENITDAMVGFEKENPNIVVELEMVPAGEMEKKILLNHAIEGTDYDIFFVNHTSTGMLAKSGVLADLTDLSKAAGLSIDTFNNALKTTCYANGKLYAIPFESDVRIMSYNKKMFSDENIEIPGTIDEFMAAAKALTKDGKYGFAQPFSSWSIAYELTEFFYGDGGSLLVKNGDTYKANFNTAAGVTFIKRMKELKNYMPKDFVSFDYTRADAAFLNGQVAMKIDGPWILGKPGYKNANFEIGNFPIPSGSVKSASVIGGWLYGISSDSKNKEAAIKVLAYLSRPEINGAAQNGLSPVTDAYNYSPMTDAKYDIYKDVMKTAVVVFPEGYLLAAQTIEAYFKEFSAVLLQNGSAEDGAKAINDAIQKVIDDNK